MIHPDSSIMNFMNLANILFINYFKFFKLNIQFKLNIFRSIQTVNVKSKTDIILLGHIALLKINLNELEFMNKYLFFV